MKPAVPASEVFTSTADVDSVVQAGSELTASGTASQSQQTQTQDDVWVRPIHPPEDDVFPDLYPSGFRRVNEGGWRERQGAPPDGEH